MISPLTQAILLAGLPTVLLIFLFQVILGLEGPHQPVWVRPFCFTVLIISCPMSVWWLWFAPRTDFLTLTDQHLYWRVSLSRWEWFRSRGCVPLSQLAAFSYRTDGFLSEPVDCGKTPAEKIAWLLLEVNLSRHDLALHLKGGRRIVVERLLARFEADDLRTLFGRLGAVAQRQEIRG